MRLGLSTPLVRMLDLHGDQNASAGVTARAVTPLSSARLMYASTWSRFWQPPSDSPTPYQRTCGSSSAWSSSTSPRGTAAHAGALAQRHSPTWTQCSTTKRVRASRSQCARGGRTAATTHKPWAEGAGCPASRRRQWTAANATRPDRRYQTGTSAAKSAFTPRHCRGDHLTDFAGTKTEARTLTRPRLPRWNRPRNEGVGGSCPPVGSGASVGPDAVVARPCEDVSPGWQRSPTCSQAPIAAIRGALRPAQRRRATLEDPLAALPCGTSARPARRRRVIGVRPPARDRGDGEECDRHEAEPALCLTSSFRGRAIADTWMVRLHDCHAAVAGRRRPRPCKRIGASASLSSVRYCRAMWSLSSASPSVISSPPRSTVTVWIVPVKRNGPA